ncbi:hypothetical protein BpHYR1_003282 [Brachionus plicatilis]|uniref:Uncharacterized protein n=1 Tax=Brachionus plicatilis TaxID=10195 RepID=A0A3M7RE96_BRAPC|nr:hypothetical protein BpHYR1_003282 [Brachionus plicatilis]
MKANLTLCLKKGTKPSNSWPSDQALYHKIHILLCCLMHIDLPYFTIFLQAEKGFFGPNIKNYNVNHFSQNNKIKQNLFQNKNIQSPTSGFFWNLLDLNEVRKNQPLSSLN